MKIITDNATNVSIFSGENLTLDAEKAADPVANWEYRGATTANAALVDGVTLPEGYVDGQWSYVAGTWAQVVFPPPAPPAAWDTLIDIGPFFDRFGAHKYPILMSADATVQALVKDLQVRKWVDLSRVDVGQGLDLLISKSLLDAGGKVAALALPVADDENFALRKVYFS